MTTWSLGLTILFEHVFVDISRSHGCNRTQCKAWQKKKYEAGIKRGMNWTCPMNKLFLDQSNGIKCYRIMKIIPQAFHRVQDHQNRNPEWKVMPKLRCAENRAQDDPTVPFLWAPDELLRRRKQVYKHRMIWWYHRMIASVHPMLFRETYREVFAQKCLAPDEPTLSSVHPTLKKCSNAQDFFRIL
jgi:hypothetical protein